MHVVLYFPGIVPPADYGGVERVVFWIARELVRRNVRVSLMSSPLSTIESHLPQVKLIPLPADGADYRRLIPRDADVVHFHEIPPGCVLPTTPFLMTEHGNRRPAPKYPPNTVFLSRSHAANHNGARYVYNGIPLDDYPLMTAKQDCMLFMAKLSWSKKNAKTAINLALDLDMPLKLAGGDLWQTPKLRGSWKWRGRGRFDLLHSLGSIGGLEKLRHLQQSSILFYLVNWQEPFALAPHEALCCGTPVLASPNGALAEYIQHGVNGYLVSTYREALETLREHRAKSPAETAAMAEACRSTAFSIETCVNAYVALYEEVIRNGYLYPPGDSQRIRFTHRSATKIRRPLFLRRSPTARRSSASTD